MYLSEDVFGDTKDMTGAEDMAVVKGMKTMAEGMKTMAEDRKNGIRNEGKKEEQNDALSYEAVDDFF